MVDPKLTIFLYKPPDPWVLIPVENHIFGASD